MLLILTLFQDNDGWRLSAEGHLGVCFGSMALMAISEKCGLCVRCLALCEAVTGRREAVMYLFPRASLNHKNPSRSGPRFEQRIRQGLPKGSTFVLARTAISLHFSLASSVHFHSIMQCSDGRQSATPTILPYHLEALLSKRRCADEIGQDD